MNKSLLFTLSICLPALGATDAPVENWPSWRGPLSTGVAPKANPPVQWSETSNVKWKVSIPSGGNSSPVVWKDQIFVLSSIPTGKNVAVKAPPAEASAPKPAAAATPVASNAGAGDATAKAGGTSTNAPARNRGGGQGGAEGIEKAV